MNDQIDNNGTGESFDIDAITNLIVPFTFEFEGKKLIGKWYKYKTVTPDWAMQRAERQLKLIEHRADLDKQLRQTRDQALAIKIGRDISATDEEIQRAIYDWIADAITEWNATYKSGEPVPIETIRFKSFPIPFMVKLGQHLEADRKGENPTSSDSSSG